MLFSFVVAIGRSFKLRPIAFLLFLHFVAFQFFFYL